LPSLRVQNPNLKIELRSMNNTEQMEALKNGIIDIAFMRDNLNNDEIQSQFVLREPLMLLIPHNHSLAQFKRIPVKLLDNIDFIIPSPEQSSI
ncbi:LysR substrate-binding domain-containing protein, partial [Acinetobacter baumannii]